MIKIKKMLNDQELKENLKLIIEFFKRENHFATYSDILSIVRGKFKDKVDDLYYDRIVKNLNELEPTN